jgi:hypothetical protein
MVDQEDMTESNDIISLRHRAAVAAVAVALAIHKMGRYPHPNINIELSGYWQSTQRTYRLGQHSNMYSRKPRGSS